MKNKNNTQRNSPSSPQCESEPCLEAGEGLDVTACSASSLIDLDRIVYHVDIGKLPKYKDDRVLRDLQIQYWSLQPN